MTAQQLLVALGARGITVEAEGDGLRVRPSGALTDADRDALRLHKAELLALLTAPGTAFYPGLAFDAMECRLYANSDPDLTDEQRATLLHYADLCEQAAHGEVSGGGVLMLEIANDAVGAYPGNEELCQHLHAVMTWGARDGYLPEVPAP